MLNYIINVAYKYSVITDLYKSFLLSGTWENQF